MILLKLRGTNYMVKKKRFPTKLMLLSYSKPKLPPTNYTFFLYKSLTKFYLFCYLYIPLQILNILLPG